MTKDEQIIKAALEDGNLSYSQAAAYRLLLRCAEQLSAMENLEKEEASGGRSAATPSPNQVSGAKPNKGEAPCTTGNVNFSGPAPESGLDPRVEAARAEANRLLEEKRWLESQIEHDETMRENMARKLAACHIERNKLDAAAMVRQFHRKFGVPIAAIPAFPERDRMDLRVRLIAEEFCEFLAACEYDYTLDITRFAGEKTPGIEETEDVFFKTWKSLDFPTMVAAADGLADLQYVIEGTALEFGIPLASVFAEVHRSNMTKTGQPDAGGKITKGEGYEPPQIERVLREHGWEG